MKLIDVDEAFEVITDLAGQADTKGAYKAFWVAARAIKEMQTVDAVEVVHASWIYECKNRIRCPVCGKSCNVDSHIYKNYCGFCGAKMDGDGNG